MTGFGDQISKLKIIEGGLFGAPVNEISELRKSADEARRMASSAKDATLAKACLEIAADFEQLAESFHRLALVSSLRKSGRGRSG